MRRKSNAGAWTEVAKDVERLEALRNLVCLLDIDGHGAAPTRGVAGCRARVPFPARQVQQPLRLPLRLLANGADAHFIDYLQTGFRRVQSRDARCAVQHSPGVGAAIE